MAERAKPKGAAKKKKPGNGRSVEDQVNALQEGDVRKYFDDIHRETDEMEEANAAARGAIGRIYDKLCDKLDVSKDAAKLVFSRERAGRKMAAKIAKMDARARDSLERLVAAYPEETPMYVYFKRMLDATPAQAPAEG